MLILIFISAITFAFIFKYLGIPIIIAFFLTLLSTLIVYIIYLRIKNTYLINILDEKCDPEAFLSKIIKMENSKSRNPLYISMILINKAVAKMALSNYQEASSYLDEIDISKISKNNHTYTTYIINRITCYYELGEFQEAEKIYEKEIVLLRAYEKRYYRSIQILVGERYFYLKKYDESYEHLRKLLNRDLCKRQYLEVLFLLAQMDIIKHDAEKAIHKLNKIVKHGNKLGIVKSSQELLKKI